jgi:hypothetical protein
MEKKKQKKVQGKKKISKQEQKQNNILKNVLLICGIVIVLIVFLYGYAQSQIHFNYEGIEFEAVNVGNSDNPLLMYETRTLLPSNEGAPFGFRLRTKPSELKRVEFENLENFELMKINGYQYKDGNFNCEGYGLIAIENLKRTFEKMGTPLVFDENETCDEEGRYNYFYLVYGDKTEIKEIGNHCYELVIEGNDESCEILEATEKLMVEVFVKYKDLD